MRKHDLLNPRKNSPRVIVGKHRFKVERRFDAKRVIGGLWTYFKPFKGRIACIIIMALIGAIIHAGTIFSIGYVYDNFIMRKVDEKWLQAFSTFCLLMGVCITLYCVNNLFLYLLNKIALHLTEWHVCYNMRNDLMKKLQKLSINYFDTHASGELITRISNDVDNVSFAISQFLVMNIYWIFQLIAVLVVMMLINWALTLITLIVYPLLVLTTTRLTKFIRPYFAKQQNEVGKMNSFIEERISGVKIVSLYQQEKLNEKEFGDINENLTNNSVVANAFSNMLQPLNMFFNNLSFVVVSALGISLVMTGSISKDWGIIPYENSTALLIVFTILSRQLTNPTNQIVMSFGPLILAMVSGQRIFDILDEKDEEQDPKNAIKLKKMKGHVEARGLYFGYNKNKLILKDLNFKADPDKVTALVGPTGAGKTTIVSLITKFYEITSGDLLIDGVSIRKLDRYYLRSNITCVLQDTFLFSKSVRENIRYARPNATNEEVEAAAKAAYADSFIRTLPQGYDTILADNGSNLSQGQRQMLAIARAFLANAKIVILDEASSSIDTKTEMDLQKAFENLMKGRTTFMIAHRLSTIRNANNIIVLDHGRIVEQGTHLELLKKNGFYARLYKSQFNKGEQI